MPGNKERSRPQRRGRKWHFPWAFSGWLVAVLLGYRLLTFPRGPAYLPGTFQGQKIPLTEVFQVNALHRPQLWTELLVRRQLEALAGTEASSRTRRDYVRILGQVVEKGLSKERRAELRGDFCTDPRIWEVWRISALEADFAKLKEGLRNQSVEQLEEGASFPSFRVERSWLPPSELPREADTLPLFVLLGPQRQANRMILTQIRSRGQLPQEDWLLYLGIRLGTDYLFQQLSTGRVNLRGYRFQRVVLEQVLQPYFGACLPGEGSSTILPKPEENP